jgi:hypothetical protein
MEGTGRGLICGPCPVIRLEKLRNHEKVRIAGPQVLANRDLRSLEMFFSNINHSKSSGNYMYHML